MTVRLEWEDLVTARVQSPSRHRYVDDPSGLDAVRDPAVNLCIWRRAIGTGLAAWLDEVRDAMDLRAQDELDPAAPDASALVAAMPVCAARFALQRDIENLTVRYAAAVGATKVLATFATVSHDMCRKFHVDQVGVRGLCTYSGPGTHWVPEHAVLRGGLGRDAATLAASNRGVVPDLRAVQVLERGWLGLLKGESWPGNAGRGAVHRSPPAGSDGLRRILLKLDVDTGGRLRDRG